MASTPITPTETRLLRAREVAERTGASVPTLYRRIAAGTFPRPVPTGPNSSRWIEAEVEAWVAARIAERDAGSDPPRAVPRGPGRPKKRPLRLPSSAEICKSGWEGNWDGWLPRGEAARQAAELSTRFESDEGRPNE